MRVCIVLFISPLHRARECAHVSMHRCVYVCMIMPLAPFERVCVHVCMLYVHAVCLRACTYYRA